MEIWFLSKKQQKKNKILAKLHLKNGFDKIRAWGKNENWPDSKMQFKLWNKLEKC